MVMIYAKQMNSSENLPVKIMINPDHISELYLLDGNSFAIKMINGSEYVISDPEWIKIARETSTIFNDIYEFVYGEPEDTKIDRLAEKWNSHLDTPDTYF